MSTPREYFEVIYGHPYVEEEPFDYEDEDTDEDTDDEDSVYDMRIKLNRQCARVFNGPNY